MRVTLGGFAICSFNSVYAVPEPGTTCDAHSMVKRREKRKVSRGV